MPPCRFTCALAASFPGSSTLHPLGRGFGAKSIKMANATPPHPRQLPLVLMRHPGRGREGWMNTTRVSEIQSD